MEYKLYVSNLAYSVIEKDLQELFSGAGTVKSVSLIKDRVTQEPKGFGFVEMESMEDMQNAISMLNGKKLFEQPMSVSVARSREEKSGPQFQNTRKRKPRGGSKKKGW